MKQQDGSFLKRLEEFSRKNKELLAEGRQLLESLNKGQAQKYVDNPLLLSLVMEKYCDLIEERLIPSLPQPEERANQGESEQVHCPKTNKSYARDDFRKTDPTVRTIRPIPKPRPVRKLEVVSQSPNPSQSHRINDFRSTATPPRPVAVGQSPESKPLPKETKPQAEVQAPPPPKPEPVKAQPTEVVCEQTKSSCEKTDEHARQRRQTERYQCRMPIHYLVRGRDKRAVKAYSKDAGAMGLFIMANRPEKAGEQVSLEVEMPDHNMATLQAVVTWTKWVAPNLRSVDMPGFGVKIVSASENWYSYFFEAKDGRLAHA